MPPISSIGGVGAGAARGAPTQQLTQDQQREVAQLAQRDREVRQHEQAHLSAAGGLATGGPSFTYTRGPDGKQYATGGEVTIDTSAGRTPEETIAKAETIQRAANAPAQPSGQDRAVAAAAARLEQKARADLAKQQVDKVKAPAKSAVSPGQKAYSATGQGEASAPTINVTA